MKNLLLSLTLLLATNMTFAMEGPTLYGLINKEYRYVDQDDEALSTSSTGVTDVDGFESRLGAKGSHSPKDNLKVNYKIELGINSQRDGANAERIRIRLAQADLAGKYGTLTIGQAWTPNTIKMLKLDPLTGTGAQLLGLESADFVGNVSGKYGVKANYFKDLLTYTSPEMGGMQAYLTQYKSSADLSNSSAVSTVSEVVLAYNSKWFNPHFTYGKEELRGDNENADSYWNLAARFNFDKMTVALGMGKEVVGKSGTTDIEYDHMLATFSYMMNNRLTIAANYGSTDFGNKGSTTGDQTQFAIGPICKLSKNFKTRLIYKNIKRTADTASELGLATKKENKANVIIAGLTLGF
jgi:hypothetical protein